MAEFISLTGFAIAALLAALAWSLQRDETVRQGQIRVRHKLTRVV